MKDLKGKIVYIKALDHASFYEYDKIDAELKNKDYIEVIGKVFDEDEDYLYVVSFFYQEAGSLRRLTGMKIIKSCVREIRVLT